VALPGTKPEAATTPAIVTVDAGGGVVVPDVSLLLLPQAASSAAPAAIAVSPRFFFVTTFRTLGMMVLYWFARMLKIEQFHRPHACGTEGILSNQYDNLVTWPRQKHIVMKRTV
jgi:hypothetical protein